MTSAPCQAPGTPRLRPLRVSPRVAQDFCAGQRQETVWDPPRSVVQSLLYASAIAQSNGYTTAFAAFFFLRFKASIVMRQKCAQPIRGTGVAISPSSVCRRCSVPEEPRYFAKIGRQNRGTVRRNGQGYVWGAPEARTGVARSNDQGNRLRHAHRCEVPAGPGKRGVGKTSRRRLWARLRAQRCSLPWTKRRKFTLGL